jgi:hypothetical protein
LINKLRQMLQMTRSSRLLWTILLPGLEVFLLRSEKKSHFNRFCGDTQRRDFPQLEHKHLFMVIMKESKKRF